VQSPEIGFYSLFYLSKGERGRVGNRRGSGAGEKYRGSYLVLDSLKADRDKDLDAATCLGGVPRVSGKEKVKGREESH
jgi:hypothetical protein